MAGAKLLSRLVQIRALQEEQARLELEAEVARLSNLDAGVTEISNAARRSRERWFALIARSKSTEADGCDLDGSDGRHFEEFEWRLAAEQRERLASRRPALADAVERARNEYINGRIERRKIDTLTQAAERLECAAAARREQAALDDWQRQRRPKPEPTHDQEDPQF